MARGRDKTALVGCCTALRDLMNEAAVTAQVGYALLGCAVIVAVFLPLTIRSYSKKV